MAARVAVGGSLVRRRRCRRRPAAQPGFAAPGGFSAPAAAAAFGPLPLGPAAAQSGEAQRTWELWGRLAKLQTELAAHWGEIANSAAQRFVARLGSAAGAAATPEQALKLYELWVNCAEEAYAATVHKEDFARLQAELANTSAALLVEQRRHAETLVRAFGLPTRNEVDALYGQVKDLRRQLAELTEKEPPQGTTRGARGQGRRGSGAAPGADKPARARKPARAAAPRRPGKRRPRAQAARLSTPGADHGAAFAQLTLRVTQTLSRLRQARGVTVGCSAKRAVWSCGKTTLYHYLPLPGAASARRRR